MTGGAGFIGSHVCRALLNRGEDIVIVDELNDYYSPRIKLGNLESLIRDFGDARVHVYVRDICDIPSMQKCYETERFDRIIHLAARAGVRPSIHDPLLYERTNAHGTLNLLELSRKNGIKHFVYASSSSVYGDDAPVPFAETDPCNAPVSPYAASKKSCELYAHTHSRLYKLPCSGLRFFTCYGPFGRRDMAPFLFTDQLARGEPIHQFGDGTSSRDFTYIDDIVQGVVKVLDHVPGEFKLTSDSLPSDSDLHQVYNLAVGSPIILSEFIATIARELNVTPEIIVKPRQPGDVERTFADISKARRLVGYEPQFTVQEGIKRFVAWYRATEQGIPRENTQAVLKSIVVPSTFPPLKNSLIATRIHNQGSSRVGLSPDVFSHLMAWLPRALACTEHVAIAVDTTGGKMDIYDAVATVLDGTLSSEDRQRIALIGVAPWLAFVPALNALLSHAQTKGCDTILYSSLETQAHPAHIHTLKKHLTHDTLVVGARLSGHRFVKGMATINGCTTIWNTLALWDVAKLSRTGFLSISDGLPAKTIETRNSSGELTHETLPSVGAGVEEVACISIQQRLFPNGSKAKLLSMTAPSEEEADSTIADTEAQEATAAATATTSATSEDADEEEEEETDGENLLYDESRTPSIVGRRSVSAPQAIQLPGPAIALSCIHPSTCSGRRPSVPSARVAPAVVRSAVSTAAGTCTGGVNASTPAVPSTSTATGVVSKSDTTIPLLFWDASFGGDVEREAAHEKKMKSKIERAQQQLEYLQLQPGTVEHIHVALPCA